ncbi:hypothetical protein [Staphylococcus aureus]|uniref:hypothetical protein n=1 Tax=Staphylococcus aureus TaxID=1280 RepID=UPI000A31FDF5|nr:hypothetical protein [Staphylococcus aureus]
MQLQTMSNSIFIKNLIFAINESLEYSETNSVMEVTFQKAIGFTQYNFEGEKLKLKDDLKELISLVGREEAVLIFVNRLNEGLYCILNQLIEWDNLNYQFAMYKEAMHNYLFNTIEKLNDDTLFLLHQDGLITLPEHKYKTVAVKSTFGSRDFTFRFKFPEESDTVNTQQMLNKAISITGSLANTHLEQPQKYKAHFKKIPIETKNLTS